MDYYIENIGGHICFVVSNFNPNTKICLYMPCHHFLNNLEKGELFIKKKKMFEDNGERQLPIGSLFTTMAVDKNVPPQRVNHQEIQRRIELFQKYPTCGGLLTSCWTMREEENYFMWYVYAHKFGVRVMTTIEKFITSIRTNDYYLICGEMMYKKKPEMKSLISNLFWKQIYYLDEQEFRFILFPTNDDIDDNDEEKGLAIPIDWNLLEPQVLLSPFLKESCLTEKLHEYEGRYAFLQNVKPSNIIIRL